jgi:hypothetical protein
MAKDSKKKFEVDWAAVQIRMGRLEHSDEVERVHD